MNDRWKSYKFTKENQHLCSLCLDKLEPFTSPGIGRLCESCQVFWFVEAPNLVILGLVRDIKVVVLDYHFLTLIDGQWMECFRAMTCWSKVRNSNLTVPIGTYDLARWLRQKPETQWL